MLRTTLALKDARGFTLVELLIVVIVLGILAAIVVVSVGSTRKNAAESACNAGVKSVELSAEAYNTRTGHYPDIQADVHGVDGMLRAWPTSDQFSLAYDATGFFAGPPVAHASGFTITVKDSAGVTVASCNDL